MSDGIWAASTHSQYDQLLSVALSAVAGGLKLKVFPHACASFGWHGGTYNELTNEGAMYIIR